MSAKLKRKIENTEEKVFEDEESSNLKNIFKNDFKHITLESESESDVDADNEADSDDELEDIESEDEKQTNGEKDSDEDEDDSGDEWEDAESEDEKQINGENDSNEDEDDSNDAWEDVESEDEKQINGENDSNEDDGENNSEHESEEYVSSEDENDRSKEDHLSENELGRAGSSKGKQTKEQSIPTKDEYEGEDSSDEEDLRNTVGNIPSNWYDEYEHLGYGLDGLPVMKPDKGDTLDRFLDKLENPDHNRTVYDKQTGQNVRLTDEDLDLVSRILTGKVPNSEFNPNEPFQDLFSHEVMEMPLSGRMEDKRSFLPVKAERQKVVRLAYLMKRGLYKKSVKPKVEEKKYYDLWKPRGPDDPPLWGISNHIPAPKAPLPGHGDSYNPPPEYLISKKDEQGLKGKDMGDTKLFKGFWRKYSSVREIEYYPKLVKLQYERLLDLYLAPRKRYRKVIAEAKDFLPKLPDKKDLRPYPTMEGLVFKGHRSIIRTISVHPGGKYLASGSDDHTVRVWEIGTGRCLRTFEVEEAVKKVSWNPNPKLFLLGIAMGNMIVFLNPETYLTDKIVVQKTNAIFKEDIDQGDYEAPERILDAVKWRKPTEEEWLKGYRVVLDHFKEVKEIVWHKQGDFFASVIPEGYHRSVMIHQLSRWRTQLPFQKNKGRVQTVAFHPKDPILFVVTQTAIRVYNLKQQGLLKKIQANSRLVTCISVHPSGEHFIIGTHDRRVNWFEMECTKRPHLMRYHADTVRSISFHRKYPMFASCADDNRVVVTHGRVYDDLLKDPLVVPLKQLKGHARFDDLYVLDVAWHPYEPYLFTAGADSTIRLWH